MKSIAIALAATAIMACGLEARAQAGEDLAKTAVASPATPWTRSWSGPSYKDIANKYRGDKGAAANLAKKVKEGGKGVWGDIPMTPNAHVKDADIKTIVRLDTHVSRKIRPARVLDFCCYNRFFPVATTIYPGESHGAQAVAEGRCWVLRSRLIVAACQKEAPPPPPQKAEAPKPPPEVVVKIGQVSPLTGPQAHLGKDNDNGARLAIEEANAKGLTIGGAKVKFELVSEDDQADPKTGTIVAQKLVDGKVAGVIGHLNSGTTIPGVQDLQRRRHTADLAFGHQSQVHRAGLQGRVSRDGERRPAGQGAGRIRGRTAEAPRGSPSSTTARPTARGSPTSSRRRRRRAALPSSGASTPTTRRPISARS